MSDYWEQERLRILKEKWEAEDRLKIAESFIPYSKITEYMEAAYGRKN